MKNTPTITLLFILLALVGCVTTYNYKPLSIEVLLPAQEYFPIGDTAIATLNINSNFKNDTLFDINFLNGKIVMDTFQIDSLASIVYYNSFVDSLQKQRSFKTITDLGIVFPYIENDSVVIFTFPALDSIYRLHPFNSMCSLTQFDSKEKITTFYDYGNVEIKFILTSLWGVYSNFGLKYLVLHSDSVTYSIPLNEFSPERYLNQDRRMLIKEAAADIGYKFAGSMKPHWETAERLYYNSANYEFRQADKYAQNNEWLKAAGIWKELTTNKNKNIAAKSMYNMAIACEMQSQYDAAIDWVTEQQEMPDNEY